MKLEDHKTYTSYIKDKEAMKKYIIHSRVIFNTETHIVITLHIN
jgi:hypothetical protein